MANKVLDSYEQERMEWITDVEAMSEKIDIVHEMERQIYNRKKEITELQKAISDSHLAILSEKSTVNSLQLKYED